MTATVIIIAIVGLLLLSIPAIVLGSGSVKTAKKEPPPKLTLKDCIMKIGTTKIENTGEFYTVFAYKQRYDCCSDSYYSNGERGCFSMRSANRFLTKPKQKRMLQKYPCM